MASYATADDEGAPVAARAHPPADAAPTDAPADAPTDDDSTDAADEPLELVIVGAGPQALALLLTTRPTSPATSSSV